MNRRTLKTEKLLSSSPSPENQLLISKFLSERFSQRWIAKPQFWYPLLGLDLGTGQLNLCFSSFSGYTPPFLVFSAKGQIFPRALVTKTRVSAPAPYEDAHRQLSIHPEVLLDPNLLQQSCYLRESTSSNLLLALLF